MQNSEKNKKVLLSKQKLNVYLKKFIKKQDIEFPELAGKLGFPEDSIPYLTVKAASLSDHIRARSLAEKVTIKAIQLADAMHKEDFKTIFDIDWITKELHEPENEKALMEISLFHRCTVKPKFTLKDAHVISKTMPEIINRVANIALQMSSLETINDD